MRLAYLAPLIALQACATGGKRVAADPACSVRAASPWIEHWFDAWRLTSQNIMRLPPAPAPNFVFYDSICVYTTSRVASNGATEVDGPRLLGARLTWYARRHGDTLTMPNGERRAVALMSFTNSDRATGPFFVMAAPSYWASKGFGQEPGLTGVFLHEFSHSRQLPGMADVIGPVDAAWNFPFELDDDAVQNRFGSDSIYIREYLAERELFFRAAAAPTVADVRTLATQALAAVRSRHARWFTGKDSIFTLLDGTWLSMEGAGQWAAAAWLSDSAGGRLTREAAVSRMIGRRRFWAQDEGLGIFLVVNRLMPEWPSLVFRTPSIGAFELLQRALER